MNVEPTWIQWIVGIGAVIAALYFLYQVLPIILISYACLSVIKALGEVMKE